MTNCEHMLAFSLSLTSCDEVHRGDETASTAMNALLELALHPRPAKSRDAGMQFSLVLFSGT